VKNPAPRTEVLLEIDFFDSGSTKAIFDILKRLANCQKSNHDIEIIYNWIYLKEDESVKEMGAFFESKLDVNFTYCEKTPNFNQELLKGYN
jgi:hypothetical protein